MNKSFAWSLLTVVIVIGIIVGPRLSRTLLNAPATYAADEVVKHKDCLDTCSHTATMVTVDKDVQLEVLDWGGTGEALVFLAGLGDNAHVFDQFAYQFTDRFHVYGITRRGFGRSSQPAEGYDVDTRALDDIKVLDHLGIRRAVFVGHSFAGDELSKLGAAFPERVTKLVYLDGLDYSPPFATLSQPPSPEPAEADLTSVERYAAFVGRTQGVRAPLASLCKVVRTDAAGKVVAPISPPEISSKMVKGSQRAQFERIKAPTLLVWVPLPEKNYSLAVPYHADLTRAEQLEFERSLANLKKWQTDVVQRFRAGIKDLLVVELPDSRHYVFLRDEAIVVREMRAFLLRK